MSAREAIANEVQTKFEDIHKRGVRRFGQAWFKMNQWVIVAAQDGGLDPQEHKLVLSLIAYKVLVNFREPK